MKKHSFFVIVVITLAIGIGIWRETHVSTTTQAASQNEPALLGGTALPSTRALPAFELTDHHNHPFTNENLNNRWSFVFFGYTHCPELCPKSLGALSQLSQRIGPNPYVQFLFVSITPDLDTPERLKSFFEKEDYKLTHFIGLTGDEKTIKSLASTLGIYIAEEAHIDLEHLGHSGAVLLVNPKGELAAVFTSAENPHRIAHDFREMMTYFARG